MSLGYLTYGIRYQSQWRYSHLELLLISFPGLAQRRNSFMSYLVPNTLDDNVVHFFFVHLIRPPNSLIHVHAFLLDDKIRL